MNIQNYNPQAEMAVVLCCVCGVSITANPANMCVNCIRREVDISEGIPKQCIVGFCRGCERYNMPPSNWVAAELESAQLLAVLLKRVKGLNKVRLVDAGFIWTEPHSRRIKIKLVIEKAVFENTILQHTFVIEFVVTHQYCDDCHRVAAKDHWNAIVQLRQKVAHKKTFFYLEQLIMKHKAHTRTTNIKERPDGLDFYYASRSDAMKMVDFLQSVAPIRFKQSERLMSSDIQNNTAIVKYSFSVEILPICKDDFVCLPAKLARSLGNITQTLLCTRVGTSLKLMDPVTLQICDVSNNLYWRQPFQALCSYNQLTQYIVLDIEIIKSEGKYCLADIECARVSDFGVNDTVFFTKTHLGHIFQAGDYFMGYDVGTLNANNVDFDKLDQYRIPPVIVVKKHYPNRRKARKTRKWKLDTLSKEMEYNTKAEEEKARMDYEAFMQDIEEDREYRATINIFRDPNIQQHNDMDNMSTCGNDDEDLEEDFPEPTLEEMMEGLQIEEAPQPLQGEYDPMVPLNHGMNNPFGF